MGTCQPFESFPFPAVHEYLLLGSTKGFRGRNELLENIHTAAKLAEPVQKAGNLILREKSSMLRSDSPYFQGRNPICPIRTNLIGSHIPAMESLHIRKVGVEILHHGISFPHRKNCGPYISGKKDFRFRIIKGETPGGVQEVGGYRLESVTIPKPYFLSLILQRIDAALVVNAEMGQKTHPK